MHIDLSLFPAHGSPYMTTAERELPMSILALHMQIVCATGNSLQNERSKGHYFFRNESIPLPRPATFLAWHSICRIGKIGSPYFLLPFLPSLRADDETGDAIQTKGAKVPSLSRRSAIHLRDEQHRIIWGSVYLASIESLEQPLLYEFDRSNITEAQLRLQRRFIWGKSQNESIRHRMEFLGSFGLPASNGLLSGVSVPPVKRLLLQFLSQKAATTWASYYATLSEQVIGSSSLARNDFHDLMAELLESRRSGSNDDSKESAMDRALGKFSLKSGSLDDFSF